MMPNTLRRIEIELTGDPASPGRARRAVEHLLLAHLRGEADGQYLSDAKLLTSELVTNAIRHAAGGCTLNGTFDADLGVLTIEVSDGSTALPLLGPPEQPYVIGGHGLHLVDRVAHRWGTHPTASGKTVWFELVA